MAFLILLIIFCVVWCLIKAMSGLDNDSQPSTSPRQHNKVVEQPVKKTFIPDSGVSRMEFLKKYGWNNTPRKYFVAYKPFPIDILPGYCKYPFIGTQYRDDVTIEDIGWFNGFAFCEITNAYDKHAIAIIREDGKLLGYIPKGDMELFFYIFNQGCLVHAYGALSYNPEADKWMGVVAIKTSEDILEGGACRFDNPNITFYETTANLMDYIKETQEKLKKEIG